MKEGSTLAARPIIKAEDLVTRIKQFVVEELIPIEEQFLLEGFESVKRELHEKRDKAKKLRLWAPGHPEKFGGLGLGLADFALVSEALGYSPIGHYVFNCQAPDIGNAELICLYGTEPQKDRWLPELIGGDVRSCFGMTERNNSGANPLFLKTVAVRDGGDWVLDGDKWFTTGADGADLCVVMAVTDSDSDGRQSASMILVPMDTSGVELTRNTPIMGESGGDWSSHGELKFENCRVPLENTLGEVGQGFRMAQARLGPGRIHHCMRWLGICQRSLDLMIQRASSRIIGHNGRKLAESDIIKSWIAESAAQIRAARLMTIDTAKQIEEIGSKEARNDISMLKYFVANVMQDVVDRALQVHGGLGVTDYTVLSYFYREERAARIYDGPDEVHKLAVARRLLATAA